MRGAKALADGRLVKKYLIQALVKKTSKYARFYLVLQDSKSYNFVVIYISYVHIPPWVCASQNLGCWYWDMHIVNIVNGFQDIELLLCVNSWKILCMLLDFRILWILKNLFFIPRFWRELDSRIFLFIAGFDLGWRNLPRLYNKRHETHHLVAYSYRPFAFLVNNVRVLWSKYLLLLVLFFFHFVVSFATHLPLCKTWGLFQNNGTCSFFKLVCTF